MATIYEVKQEFEEKLAFGFEREALLWTDRLFPFWVHSEEDVLDLVAQLNPDFLRTDEPKSNLAANAVAKLKEGDMEEAASLFQSADLKGISAQAFKRIKRYPEVARLAEEVGLFNTAGSFYSEAGMHAESGRAYEIEGHDFSAFESYMKAGMLQKALVVGDRYLSSGERYSFRDDDCLSVITSLSPESLTEGVTNPEVQATVQVLPQLQKLFSEKRFKELANLLESLGFKGLAEQAYVRAGAYGEAVRIVAERGDAPGLVTIFLDKAGWYGDIGRLYERDAEKETGFRKRNLMQGAHREYLQAGWYGEAGRIALTLTEHEKDNDMKELWLRESLRNYRQACWHGEALMVADRLIQLPTKFGVADVLPSITELDPNAIRSYNHPYASTMADAVTRLREGRYAEASKLLEQAGLQGLANGIR